MKDNFVLFRYPGDTQCHMIECDEARMLFLHDLDRVPESGCFVFAPYKLCGELPIVVFPDDGIVDIPMSGLPCADIGLTLCGEVADRDSYAADFSRFHAAVRAGKISKLVLSRKTAFGFEGEADIMAMFGRACRMNRQSFVAVVGTRRTGTWLMATPEILLERGGREWHTIALAGTMPSVSGTAEPVWSDKNREEQRYVADYIRETVGRYSGSIREHGPYTYNAGNIVHLRTDFYFTPVDGCVKAAEVASALHPTPAVCGLPVGVAGRFIAGNETLDREYYSGFCGRLCKDGDFRLFVILRCMKLAADTAELFAGGGILPDSREEEEWKETVSKMLVMKRILTDS